MYLRGEIIITHNTAAAAAAAEKYEQQKQGWYTAIMPQTRNTYLKSKIHTQYTQVPAAGVSSEVTPILVVDPVRTEVVWPVRRTLWMHVA